MRGNSVTSSWKGIRTRKHLRRLGLAVCLGIMALLLGCSDNATRLSLAIEDVSKGAPKGQPENPKTLDYRPKRDSGMPYWLIFLPDRDVGTADLERAGLPSELVETVFAELAYLGIGETPFLIFSRGDEPLRFTTHWSRCASVPEVLAIRGLGTTTLSLQTTEAGLVVIGADGGD